MVKIGSKINNEDISTKDLEEELDNLPSNKRKRIKKSSDSNIKDIRDEIIESIPLSDIKSLVEKFGCLKQYTLKHSKLNGVEVVTKIPRWADPNNSEPDNQLRKRILKWVQDMQARTKLTVI